MLRACCERVAKMLRTWLLATSNIRSFSSLLSHVATMLRLYCGHVATHVACNIQHQEHLLPSPRHNTQHQMSATSKHNICNIEKTMFVTTNNKRLQHRDSASATSKLMVATSNIGGPTPWTQHTTCLQTSKLSVCNIEINGCNIQHQRAYPLDTTHNMSATSKLNIRDI
jgi:hypothetical protein